MNNILSLCLFPLLLATTLSAERESYVVYLGSHRHELNDAASHTEAVTNSHTELLGSVLHGKENATDSIFYSYTNAINGFAAMLEEDEASQVSKHPDVVSVIRDKSYHLLTTHSWEFLGQESEEQVLPYSLWKKASLGEDMIVANLDSGVAPEAESFRDDTGYGVIPERWKGFCQNQTDANGTRCNRKLIGARNFAKGYGKHPDPAFGTPRDFLGHGTKTLSIAGGNRVSNAGYYGYARGTLKGGAPRARVAAYKVCARSDCPATDMLAAFDAAISDGVDVLSISIAGHAGDDYDDVLAIGTFHAVSKGISVVLGAGNDGPTSGTVSNVAPWQLTVGASIMDRSFPVDVLLGNNKTIKGQGLYHPSDLPQKKLFPLLSPIRTGAECWKPVADPKKVKGKIVICVGEEGDESLIQDAGGVGMILVSPRGRGYSLVYPQPLPTAQLIGVDGQELLAYMKSTKSPVAYIGKPTTVLQSKPAPIVARFSSRGPNVIAREILKPDVIAPGVGILASSIVMSEKFVITYGTSMACPHVAGIVTLLKKVHPYWSPAAIKSAIMTTGHEFYNSLVGGIKVAYEVREATPFDYGAGHVVPNKAVDPGLVYDLGTEDYLNFFCAVGYNSSRVSKISGRPYTCPSTPAPRISDLNYPSIGMVNIIGSATTSRTLKNVGTPGIYTVSVRSPDGFNVTVTPTSLQFSQVGEEKKFTVTVTLKKSCKTKSDYQFGWLIWSDGVHHVRSVIFLKTL